MKILIYGSGYLGTAMARYWKAAGHEISLTFRSTAGSIARKEILQNAAQHVLPIKEGHMRALLDGHEALLICVAPGPQDTYRETYYETALNIINHLPSSVDTLLYISSTSVYGDYEGAVVDEEMAPVPMNANSKILLETENLFLSQCAHQTAILRLGEIIGPDRFLSGRLKKAGSKPFPGSGSQATNLSALPDIVKGLDFVLAKRLRGVYNFCADFHPSRHSLYQQISSLHKLPSPLWDKSKAPLHSGNKVISSQKIQQAGFIFNTLHNYFLS